MIHKVYVPEVPLGRLDMVQAWLDHYDMKCNVSVTETYVTSVLFSSYEGEKLLSVDSVVNLNKGLKPSLLAADKLYFRFNDENEATFFKLRWG